MTDYELTAPTDLREPEARRIVSWYANWSLAPGILPTPILDIALLIGIQLRMVDRLSKLYVVPFSSNVGKSIISSLLASVIPTKAGFGYTSLVIRTVPLVGGLLGLLFMPAFSWASTYAMGKVFIQHFESGGTFLSFNPAQVRAHFRQEFEREYAARTRQHPPGKKPEAAAAKAAAA